MNVTQSFLPLFPEPALPARARRSARDAGRVEYRDVQVREILNRSSTRRLPFAWSINPYRGCEFGCAFCFARSTHEFLDFVRWRDFERRIVVKRGAAASLEKRLRKRDLHGQPIAIGTATDPYQPAEARYGVTRELLETFDQVAGLEISITTRSPLIERDLALLTRLDHKHAISVFMTINTVDPELGRRLEPNAPTARERLHAAARLASEGIDTTLLCAPLMPGINAGSRQLLPLFEAAREIGARDVEAQALSLNPAARATFWPWLCREFPELEPRYRRLYRRKAHLAGGDRRNLLSVFRRLHLEYSFPHGVAGRS